MPDILFHLCYLIRNSLVLVRTLSLESGSVSFPKAQSCKHTVFYRYQFHFVRAQLYKDYFQLSG